MNPIFRMFVGSHVAFYKLSGGRIGGKMFGGKVLLLTTTGNKSGKKRTVPVMYFESDGKRYVIASFGGAPAHPAWYKNMEKHPEVTVQVRGHRYDAKSEVVTGEERAKVWKQAVTEMPQFDGYEKKIGPGGREIPVVRLAEG
jgi:F420H(2)-dependent quinone reductase